jgi:hypothetical protein
MAERQTLRDAVKVGRMNDGSFAETAQALGVFGLRQMAATSGIVHGFAGGGDFEPLGHGFLGFDAFGTSHKINSFAKERGIYLAARLKASVKLFKYDCFANQNRLVATIEGDSGAAGAAAFQSTGAPTLSCLIMSSVKSAWPLL